MRNKITLTEIKEAIRKQSIIEFTWDETGKRWGTLVCLSDDESCVYYKNTGLGIFHSCCRIDQVKLGWAGG